MQDCIESNDVVQAVENFKGLTHDYKAVKRFKIQLGMISIDKNSLPKDFVNFQINIDKLEKMKIELNRVFQGNEVADNLILALNNQIQEGQNFMETVIKQIMQDGVDMAQNNDFSRVMYIKECLDQILDRVNMPQDFFERVQLIQEQLGGQIKAKIEGFIEQDFSEFLNNDLKNFVAEPKSKFC